MVTSILFPIDKKRSKLFHGFELLNNQFPQLSIICRNTTYKFDEVISHYNTLFGKGYA